MQDMKKQCYQGQFRHKQAAFTLMEMLLVIVIIGILVGGLAVSLSGRSQEAMITRARADVKSTLALALDLFEQDIGRYPSDDEGLDALINDPGESKWKGPYLKTDLEPDPWGNAYEYSLDPDNSRKYQLRCAGPDGKMGTSDDIES